MVNIGKDGHWTFEELFLQFCFSDFYFNSLVYLLCMAAPMIGIVLDSGRKQSVDKGRLPQA